MYLLTGGNGTLGTELQKHLNCWAPSSSLFDIRWDSRRMADSLSEHFDMNGDCEGIIHAAAYTDVSKAEMDKKAVVEANVIGTKNIVDFARLRNLPVYHISTDYVYEGYTGNYNEIDKTGLINFYSATKVVAETFLNLEVDLIIRTSFKPNDLWETKYDKAFIDVFSSANYVDVIAPEIAFAIYSELKGIYNIGTERKSIYELAKSRYPDVQEMDTYKVSKWLNMPRDVSMDISKYLKYKNEHIEEFEEFTKRGKSI